jgi:hypothetical protein
MYVCLHACSFICTRVYVHIYVCVCMYVCIYSPRPTSSSLAVVFWPLSIFLELSAFKLRESEVKCVCVGEASLTLPLYPWDLVQRLWQGRPFVPRSATEFVAVRLNVILLDL